MMKKWMMLYLALMQGQGLSQVASEPRLDVDARTGSVSSAITLPALPGRNGFTPDISLNYQQSLGDRRQGLGAGWAFSTSSIAVDNEFGTPHPYYRLSVDASSKDSNYQVSLDGQPLRYVGLKNGVVEYTSESFDRKLQILRYDAPFAIQIRNAEGLLETREIASGFEVRQADGLRRIYSGDAAVAESYFYLNSTSLPEIQRKFVSRWPLVYEIRPGGDAIEYRYRLDQGRSYLSEISFASQRSRYVFHLSAPEAGPVSYAATYRQETRLHYTGMVACLDDQPQYTWLFSYTRFPLSNFAPLPCTPAEATEGPEVRTMSRWAALSNWFSELLPAADVTGTSGQEALYLTHIYRFGQKVGDPADASIPREATIQLSYKSWSNASDRMPAVLEHANLDGMTGLGFQNNAELFDADQDGIPDVVVYDKARNADRVFHQQGTDLVEGQPFTIRRRLASGVQTVVPILNDSLQKPGLLRGDLNGDGWDDLIEIGSDKTWTVFFNRRPMGGEGFESSLNKAKVEVSSQWLDLKVDASTFTNGRGYLLDINGDGRLDIIYPILGTDGNAQFQTYLNTTRRGSDAVTFVGRTFKFPFATSQTAILTQPEYRFIDVNEDGLVDLVKIVALTSGAKGFCLFENQGLAAMDGAALFRQDKPTPGLTCDSQWFYKIDDLEIEQSLVETINSMVLLDMNSDGTMDFARINDKAQVLEYWLGKSGEKGFAKKQMIPLPAGIKISRNKYDTLTADIDQDGSDELVLWNATTKSLQFIDLNRQEDRQSFGTGLLQQLSIETGFTQTLAYISYAGLHSAEALRPLPTSLTLVQQLVTWASDFARQPKEQIKDMTLYRYGDSRWDQERAMVLGFDRVSMLSPGLMRAGRLVQPARRETIDFASGLTSLEQHRYLGAFAKTSETADLPWDGAKEAQFQQNGTIAEDPGKTLKLAQSSYSLQKFTPALANDTGRLAHVRPRFFIHQDANLETICSGEQTGCLDPKTTKASYTYDDANFRVTRELSEESEIQGPGGQTLPARALETSYVYDTDSEQLGILNNIRLRTVKSLLTDQISVVTNTRYHPIWGLPTVTEETSYVLNEDKARLPETLAQKVPRETTHTRTSSYDGDGGRGFGVTLALQDELGLIERYEYGPASLFRIVTRNAKGHSSYECFSARDCAIPDRQPEGGGSSIAPLLIQNPQGFWTRIQRDALGRPSLLTGPLGEERGFRYRLGSLQQPTMVEETLFDSRLQRQLQKRADLFDAEGQLLVQIVDRGSEAAWVKGLFAQDRKGQTIWQSNPFAADASFAALLDAGLDFQDISRPGSFSLHDGIGRLTLQSVPGEAETTSFHYASWGQSALTSGIDGTSKTRLLIARDPEFPEALVDEEQHLHVYHRNEFGMLTRIQTEDDQEPRSLVYDTQGRLMAQVLPGIQTQVFERDQRDRVSRIHSLSFDGKQSRTIEQTYDDLDRLVRIADVGGDANGVLTELYYDQVKDPVGSMTSLPGALLGARAFDPAKKLDTFDLFQRDQKNRVVGQTTYYLDANGRIVQQADEARSYRADNQIAQLRVGSDITLLYDYDASGELAELVARFTDGKTTPILAEGHWAPQQQIAAARFGQVLRGAWDYDATHLWANERMLCKGSCEGNGVLERETYEHAASGFLKKRNADHSYAYNRRGELLASAQPSRDERWDLTAAGHFQTFNGQAIKASSRSALLPGAAADSGIAYDGFGRVTSFEGVQASYTADDHLLRTEKGGETISYGYHPSGIRSYKVVRGADGQESTSFYPSAYLTLASEARLSLQLPGRVVAELGLQDRDLSFILTDDAGTPLKRFDADGEAVESWERGAYGQLLGHELSRGSTTDLALGGHREDKETQWIAMGQRVYIPGLGTFTTADPLFLADPEGCIQDSWQECELYVYVANNPVNFRDPTGLMKEGHTSTASTSSSSKAGSSKASTSTSRNQKPKTTVSKPLPALKSASDYHIYRMGGNTHNALTPREKDTTGLSFSKDRPTGSFHVSTIETVNMSGVLHAENDHGRHVSITPAHGGHEAMASWIASKATANENPHALTLALREHSEFHSNR